MADAQLCLRIACGAVSQAEAGMQALYECSAAGYAGVLPCSHPDCRPYLPEMRARGMCPAPEPERVFELLPLHPPVQPDEGEAPLPPVERVPARLAAPMPHIATHPASPYPERVGVVAGRDYYCEFMRWVSANQCLAAACLIGAWWVLSGRGYGRR